MRSLCLIALLFAGGIRQMGKSDHEQAHLQNQGCNNWLRETAIFNGVELKRR